MRTFPHIKQLQATDCGPTCLKMIAGYYGISYDSKYLEKISGLKKMGTNFLGISKAAKKIGLYSIGLQINIEQLNEIELPVIAHWNQNHFVVLFNIENDEYDIADPASNNYKLSKAEFMKHWLGNTTTGVVLMFAKNS